MTSHGQEVLNGQLPSLGVITSPGSEGRQIVSSTQTATPFQVVRNSWSPSRPASHRARSSTPTNTASRQVPYDRPRGQSLQRETSTSRLPAMIIAEDGVIHQPESGPMSIEPVTAHEDTLQRAISTPIQDTRSDGLNSPQELAVTQRLIEVSRSDSSRGLSGVVALSSANGGSASSAGQSPPQPWWDDSQTLCGLYTRERNRNAESEEMMQEQNVQIQRQDLELQAQQQALQAQQAAFMNLGNEMRELMGVIQQSQNRHEASLQNVRSQFRNEIQNGFKNFSLEIILHRKSVRAVYRQPCYRPGDS